VLRRKALREGRLHGLSDGQVEEMIRNVVARAARVGYVDDKAYAITRARGLSGRGRSLRRVRADLASRGVDRETTEGAVARLREEQADPELVAALVLARRKRLGPWRPMARLENRGRDVDALVRAGFDSGLAREIVGAASPEELEERLAELLAGDGSPPG
jgi:regulatory protein